MATRIGYGATAVKVEGLAALQARVHDLISRTTGEMALAAGLKLHDVIAEATELAEAAVLAKAHSVNVPHDVYRDVFTYRKMKPGERGRRTMLVGVRKRSYAHAYREWFPNRQTGKFAKSQRSNRRGKRLVMPGFRDWTGNTQKIGENLATMWELGTTKMQARPFFGPAVAGVRARIEQRIVTGLQDIINDVVRSNP